MPSEAYQPPAGGAGCPHCGAVVEVAVSPAALDFALLRLRCPACTQIWSETRQPQAAVRYWDSADEHITAPPAP